MRALVSVVASFSLFIAHPASAAPAKNVVIVVIDGLRPREIFEGAERALMTREGGVESEDGLVAKYWRESPEERRAALMPFIWGTMAQHGQVLGNASLGASMRVTNTKRLSYPGYNEMFTGVADPAIDSNEHAANENQTVLEWLAAQRTIAGQVQVFATWETFFRIFNVERSHLDVRAGWNPPFEHDARRTSAKDAIDTVHLSTTPMFGGNTLDAFTMMALKESLKEKRPRVLFVGLGETDEWMHAGRYDMALEAMHRADASIAELWKTLQSMPAYRDSTALLVTTDHGRGVGARDWRHHQSDIEGSDEIWLAAMGPSIPALGERAQLGATTQNQIAATIAELMGFQWRVQRPDAAPALCFEPAPRVSSN